MKRVLLLFLISLLLLGQQLLGQQPAPTVFPFGVIDHLYSSELQENRTLNIYLPDGYATDSTARYPVIYLLDGSANEDYPHIAGLAQFMNMYELLPKSIVVGIANVDRKRDFTFPTTVAQDKKDYPTTGSSAKFIAFIEKELQPFIDQHYRSSSAKTIIGQSLGGLLAAEILLKKPDLFDTYVLVSPSFWWDNESLLKQAKTLLKKHPELAKRIYLSVGDEHRVMKRDARKFKRLLTKNTGKGCLIHFEHLKNETHATILHRSVYNALEFFNRKKKS